jgi:hypothetical protein
MQVALIRRDVSIYTFSMNWSTYNLTLITRTSFPLGLGPVEAPRYMWLVLLNTMRNEVDGKQNEIKTDDLSCKVPTVPRQIEMRRIKPRPYDRV